MVCDKPTSQSNNDRKCGMVCMLVFEGDAGYASALEQNQLFATSRRAESTACSDQPSWPCP